YLFHFFFFFFNDTATTEIYTLSLHDALPISGELFGNHLALHFHCRGQLAGDRKSTRLNSSHANISYAVFCLKKKKNHYENRHIPICLINPSAHLETPQLR